MFLFRSEKKLDHKHTTVIGFVIAVMSLLITGFIAYVPPAIIAFMYQAGVARLELYFVLFNVILFLLLQFFVLFGFPLFYAADKDDHKTGFQILLYAIMWMIVLFSVIILISTQFFAQKVPSLDDLSGALQQVQTEAPVSEGTTTDPAPSL